VSPPLPSPLRLVSIGTTLLAAFLVLGSWIDLLEGFSSVDTSEVRRAVEQQGPFFSRLYGEEALVFVEAFASSLEARQSTLGDMRSLRMLVLFGLCISATALFMLGWRLMLMAPSSRPRIVRMLSKTALACAIFRTLDGAQAAALARRTGAAFDLAAAFKTQLPQNMETTLSFFSIAWTFFVVALLFWGWRYFQAPKTLALLEKNVPSSSSPPLG